MNLPNISEKKDLVPDEYVRWVKILDEEPGIAPKLEFELAYLDRNNTQLLAKPAQKKRKQNQETDDEDETRFRDGFTALSFRGWRGACLSNLLRISDKAFINQTFLREEFVKLGLTKDTDEIDFSLENARWFVNMMNGEVVGYALSESQDQEKYFLNQKRVDEKN